MSNIKYPGMQSFVNDLFQSKTRSEVRKAVELKYGKVSDSYFSMRYIKAGSKPIKSTKEEMNDRYEYIKSLDYLDKDEMFEEMNDIFKHYTKRRFENDFRKSFPDRKKTGLDKLDFGSKKRTCIKCKKTFITKLTKNGVSVNHRCDSCNATVAKMRVQRTNHLGSW